MSDNSKRQNVSQIHKTTITHRKNDRNGKPTTVVVSAYSPDNYKLGFSTRWGKNFVGKSLEGLARTVNPLASLAGGALASPLTTALAYEGTDSPSLDLVLQFNAENNTYNDVMGPVKNLVGMCVPEMTSNISISVPGPNAMDYVLGLLKGDTNSAADGSVKVMNEVITLRIGTYLNITPVVVSGVSVDFGSVYDADGLPMSASVSLKIQPFVTPYRNQIDNWFAQSEGGDYAG